MLTTLRLSVCGFLLCIKVAPQEGKRHQIFQFTDFGGRVVDDFGAWGSRVWSKNRLNFALDFLLPKAVKSLKNLPSLSAKSSFPLCRIR